jgi:hypothetical protein
MGHTLSQRAKISTKRSKKNIISFLEDLESRLLLSASAIPRPDHVVVVIEENHAYSSIIGSSSAPYINALAQSGALFTQSFAITHPSEPNYLALFSGSTQGVTTDATPTTIFTTANLGASLRASSAGLSFAGYSESLPAVGSLVDSYTTVAGQNQYMRKHNPWADWQNDPTPGTNQLPGTVNQPFTAFPTDFTQLPTVSVVVPNEQNDMHDGTIAQGDTWLKTNIDAYAQWAKAHNGLLIVTWDEDDTSHSNQIPTIFSGAAVATGQYSETINHYNVLRTIEDMYGLPLAGSSATATPITDSWVTASRVGFTTSAQTVTAGVKSGNISIQLLDPSGNPITAGVSGQTVNLTSTSATGVFLDAGSNVITSVTMAPGIGTATFTYRDIASGTPTLTAAGTGLTSATQQETVIAAAPSQILVTTAAQTLTAGVASGTVTLQLKDAFGNIAKAGTAGLAVTFTSSSTAGSFLDTSNNPITGLTVAAGASTASFKYKDTVAGTPTITAAATGLTAATQKETVVAAAPAKIVFTTTAQTVTAGAVSGTITIQLKDAFGNVAIAPVGGTTITLSSSSTSGKFLNTGKVVITSIIVAAGANTASFEYTDTLVGTPIITASASGLTSATQQETVAKKRGHR